MTLIGIDVHQIACISGHICNSSPLREQTTKVEFQMNLQTGREPLQRNETSQGPSAN